MHVEDVCPPEILDRLGKDELASWSDQGGRGVAQLSRLIFKESVHLEKKSKASDDAIDRGFQAIRLLRECYTPALEALCDERDRHTDRTRLRHSVGTPFRHRKFGYR
ncbi:hypothetical protein CYMTET_15979, partial [Cymbomonas tetramitiformis]